MGRITKKSLFLIDNIKIAFQSLGWHKDSTVVLIGAWFGDKFADNSRFLFQYLSEEKEKLGLSHVVWVSRSKEVVDTLHTMGYEAYLMDSKESIKYHKKAKYHVICNSASSGYEFAADVLTKYSWRAKRVNLWHGVGVVKGVGCDSNEYLTKKNANKILYIAKELLQIHSVLFRKLWGQGGWLDCYLVAPSVEERTKMQKEFLLPKKNFIITGYARNGVCPSLTEHEQQVIKIIKTFKKIILYMPTFKTDNNNFDFRTVGFSLKSFLEDNKVLWIQKGHSADKFSSGFSYSGHILSLPSVFDTNTIISHVSIVITDYSSAMMDALYHQKPVLLYVPDYDEFIRGERGLIPEANEIMTGCGNIYKNIDELKEGIVSALDNPASAKPERYQKTRNKYWGQEKTLAEIWQDIVHATK